VIPEGVTTIGKSTFNPGSNCDPRRCHHDCFGKI
jgi:hypothetical protein